MLAIRQGVPTKEILGAFRHVRNHLEQHDSFVEMVEIVGSEPGTGIDIGRTQLRGAYLIRRCRARFRAIGSPWFGAPQCHHPQS